MYVVHFSEKLNLRALGFSLFTFLYLANASMRTFVAQLYTEMEILTEKKERKEDRYKLRVFSGIQSAAADGSIFYTRTVYIIRYIRNSFWRRFNTHLDNLFDISAV